ncbi:hypothetical protein [Bosea vestrisii]|uniref:SnoaL-like domain-containing protein n=1 Tax=Bosea vestrisii TaxID=151416 RepID=A0ABW0HNY0_9HYPH
MTKNSAVDVVLAVLTSVERRDRDRLGLYHPQIEFRWPPSLPYGGAFRGEAEVGMMVKHFGEIWNPLQPTPEERRLDPRVVAIGEEGRVVVNYIWRGLDQQKRRFETETLAEYQVRDGMLARAQMFYFDLVGLASFLEGAGIVVTKKSS